MSVTAGNVVGVGHADRAGPLTHEGFDDGDSAGVLSGDGWLAHVGVPLFVSHRRLARRKTLPRARSGWALDSGGFSELSLYGGWRTTAEDYVAAKRTRPTRCCSPAGTPRPCRRPAAPLRRPGRQWGSLSARPTSGAGCVNSDAPAPGKPMAGSVTAAWRSADELPTAGRGRDTSSRGAPRGGGRGPGAASALRLLDRPGMGPRPRHAVSERRPLARRAVTTVVAKGCR